LSPGVACVRESVRTGRHLDFLEARQPVQLRFVALLDADLADVVGALVVVRVAPRIVGFLVAVVLVAHRVDPVLVALRDPADIADHVRGGRAERVLAEQPRAHVDAGKAEALRGEARDFVVGEPRADRQAFEVLRVFLQLLEAAAVARVDRDDLRQLVDRVLERVVELRRRDLERVGRVVLREDHAVAVGDDPAVRHDRRDGDAVFLGLQRIFAVLHQLQIEEAAREQPEADEHEHARRRDAQAELRELLLGVVEFGHAITVGRPGARTGEVPPRGAARGGCGGGGSSRCAPSDRARIVRVDRAALRHQQQMAGERPQRGFDEAVDQLAPARERGAHH